MIGMIMIHTNAYHLSSPIAAFLWNYLQFVVQIFVFCSLYLFIKKNDFSQFNWNDLLNYYKKYIPKRFLRLVLPYYIFLPFYLLLQSIITHKLPTTNYVLHSLTLTGGVDINWLVLLFLQLTLLSPLLLFLVQKNIFLKRVIVLCLCVGILLFTPEVIRKHLPNYRWIMAIGWMYYFFFAYNIIHPTTAFLKKFTKYSTILSLVAAGLGLFFPFYAHLYNQKYPPDIFFIAYGLIWITLLYQLFSKVSLHPYIQKLLNFFSINSYPLFFIHYWILVFASFYFKLNWYTFFFVVLIASTAIQSGVNYLMRYTRK